MRVGKQSTINNAGSIFGFTNSPTHKKTIKDSSTVLQGMSDFRVSLMPANNGEELIKKNSIYQQSSNSFNHSSVMYSTSTLNNPNINKEVKMVKEPEVVKISKEVSKRVILNDSEDRWFMNPQYKIHLKPGTKLIISLMQENEKLTKKVFEKVNFAIIISKVILLMTLGKIFKDLGLQRRRCG
jgi:hypothetical protein